MVDICVQSTQHAYFQIVFIPDGYFVWMARPCESKWLMQYNSQLNGQCFFYIDTYI